MNEAELIPTDTVCLHYNIDLSFVDDLYNIGLIEIEIIEQQQFIHVDQIGDLEKMIRLHQELNVNLEGIDVVLNLLKKEQELKQELNQVRNRLRLYEK
jgi:hypothetical protein